MDSLVISASCIGSSSPGTSQAALIPTPEESSRQRKKKETRVITNTIKWDIYNSNWMTSICKYLTGKKAEWKSDRECTCMCDGFHVCHFYPTGIGLHYTTINTAKINNWFMSNYFQKGRINPVFSWLLVRHSLMHVKSLGATLRVIRLNIWPMLCPFRDRGLHL